MMCDCLPMAPSKILAPWTGDKYDPDAARSMEERAWQMEKRDSPFYYTQITRYKSEHIHNYYSRITEYKSILTMMMVWGGDLKRTRVKA